MRDSSGAIIWNWRVRFIALVAHTLFRGYQIMQGWQVSVQMKQCAKEKDLPVKFA